MGIMKEAISVIAVSALFILGGGCASTPVAEFTNSVGMKFALIPASEFIMGSNIRDMGEDPPHRVRITKPFYMQTTEVTQAQWKAVMGNNPSWWCWIGDDLPVVRVSWADAQEFIKKLSTKEGEAYRLPTEAEWEYACRAGTTSTFNFGERDSKLGEYGWYWENSNKKYHVVGQKKPNAWGLYDMHGNVWEWCHDWYEDGYYSKSPVEDPRGPSSGKDRVCRGGCFSKYATICRSAIRANYDPARVNHGIGFRIVRDSHESEFVHTSAAEALSKFRSEIAVESLAKLLKDKNKVIRMAAARALSSMTDKNLVEPFLEAIQDEDEETRRLAGDVLVKIGKPAIGPLVDLLKEEDIVVRFNATIVLKEITGQDFGLDYEKWKQWHKKNKSE
jgi:formylglycine-generating enzyme required for sulfatase activity